MAAKHEEAKILPIEFNMEAAAAASLPQVIEVLNYCSQAESGLIDLSYELSTITPLGLTYCWLEALGLPEEGEAFEVVHRSQNFAYVLANQLVRHKVSFFIGDYYRDRDGLRDRIIADSDEFLSISPTLDRLIEDFSVEIDPTDRFEQLRRNVAGIAFMHLDTYNRKVYGVIQAAARETDLLIAASELTEPDS